jgi:DNA polymerase-1
MGRLWEHIYGAKKNYNSDPQLRNILFKKLKLKSTKETDSGQEATDAEALNALSAEGIDSLIRRRKYAKTKDTYFEGMIREQVDGYLHSFFNLNRAKSYRSSSSNINFQNIPNRDLEVMNMIRRAIYPLPGYQILAVDYGGVEVGTGCFYHKDPAMIKYVSDPTTDMHGDMAKQLFMLDSIDKSFKGNDKNPGEKNLRQAAKNSFVFPQFYGDYYVHCAEGMWKWKKDVILKNGTHIDKHLKAFGVGTLKKFTEHVKEVETDFWENRFRIYNQWKESFYAEYLENGYFDMLTGFRCQGVMNQKQVCNLPIQGTAFHLLLWAFSEVDQWLCKNKMKSCMMGQIHDEMLLHLWPSERDIVLPKIKQIMTETIREKFDWINVPLSVDADLSGVDKPWNEKRGIEI